jgi:glycerol uptake facilitator-like aquaporin
MFQNYFVELVSTVLFTYVVLSTTNYLVIGAVFTLIILIYKETMLMNPAITIMMSSMNRIPVSDVLPYCLAQISGALIAMEIFKRTHR